VVPLPQDLPDIFAAVDEFNAELKETGAWVFAGGLQPIETASVVDATGDLVTVSSGAALGSSDYLGGFWVIRAANTADAQSWAHKGSAACRGAVEVRPFQED
jgi:hypothetical protein